jgi:hypothetical protein
LAWRFDESVAKPMQDLHSIGMSQNDLSILLEAFLVCGFWRAALDDGLFYFTDHTFKIFEMEPHDGPVNMASLLQIVHPDDQAMLFDAFQVSMETKQTYHCIFRLITKNKSVKWVRSVAYHHVTPDGSPEVRGMTHELFQHVSSAAFMVEPPKKADPQAL